MTAKDSCLRGHDRPRVLRRMGIVLVLPVEALLSQDKGEEVDPLEDPAFRGLESQLVQVHCCAVGAITDILDNVAEAVVAAIHADRQGIMSKYCPQNPQRLQPPPQPQQPQPLQHFSLPPPVPISAVFRT